MEKKKTYEELQEEKSELKKQVYELRKANQALCLEITCQTEINESLEMQVAELTEERENMEMEILVLEEDNRQLKSYIDFKTANIMCDKCKEQAVKDTAKEIYDKVEEIWLDCTTIAVLVQRIENWIKERYGVEVE